VACFGAAVGAGAAEQRDQRVQEDGVVDATILPPDSAGCNGTVFEHRF
jgi:hypothetical protein